MSNPKPYTELTEWVPMRKVVDYALIDDWDDAQMHRQRFNNWAIRGYRKLNLNLLRIIKTVLIPIDHRTGTGRLPDDFRKPISAGYFDGCGQYTHISQVGLVEVQQKEHCGCDKCKCNQTLCDSIQYEKVEEVVTINGTPYTNTIVRTLDKSCGVYREQVTEHVFDSETNTVVPRVRYNDLCTLDVKPCGCVEETERNISLLKSCGCCGVWEYYGRHNFCNDDYFSIDEENRLIYVGDTNIRYVQLKYFAHLPCIHGEVYFPAVAVETLAAWILFKKDQRRKIAETQKDFSYRHYKHERSELRKALMPIRLDVIKNALNLVPF